MLQEVTRVFILTKIVFFIKFQPPEAGNNSLYQGAVSQASGKIPASKSPSPPTPPHTTPHTHTHSDNLNPPQMAHLLLSERIEKHNLSLGH